MEEFEVVPEFAGGWTSVAVALARKAESVTHPGRWHYLILEAAVGGEPFVQLAVRPELVLAEIRADHFADCGRLLDDQVAEVMLASGWSAPDDDRHSSRCNWWQEWPEPYDIKAIAEHALAVFVAGFDLPSDVVVDLKVFPSEDDVVQVVAAPRSCRPRPTKVRRRAGRCRLRRARRRR